jgi:hypothetical protein
MAEHWLYNPANVPPVYPVAPATNPLAYYSFNAGHGSVCVNESPSHYNQWNAAMMLMTGGGDPTDDQVFDDGIPAAKYWDRRETNLRRDRDANGVLIDPNQAIPEDANYIWDPNASLIPGTGPTNLCLETEPAGGGLGAYVKVPSALFTAIDKQITISVWLAGDPCDQPAGGWRMVFQGEDARPPQSGEHKLMAIVPLPDDDSDPCAVEWRAGVGTRAAGGDEQGGKTNQLLWTGARDSRESWTIDPWNHSNEPNAWDHYAFVKDGTTGIMRIYCNGEAVATSPVGTKTQSMSGVVEFQIGASIDGWTGHSYLGKIDEFRIYNYPLSQAEVMYLANKAGPVTSIDGGQSPADFYKSYTAPEWQGIVNFRDFQMLAPNWQKTIIFP